MDHFFKTSFGVFAAIGALWGVGLFSRPARGDWPMPGANVERTSASPDEVRGPFYPKWYTIIEPFIPPKVQIVAAYDNLYISSARGLIALRADSGVMQWVYPTAMPLGHSPTVMNGVAYVGALDHKVHAVDANTGLGIWTFQVGGAVDDGTLFREDLPAGFDTNPLVSTEVIPGQTLIFIGNRNGTFYALQDHGASVSLLWKYRAGGPIHYSAALRNGVVYFAADDSCAYALNALDGSLVWKSERLPGAGFHSWWPVVSGNLVIFSGSRNRRTNTTPEAGLSSLGGPPDYSPAAIDPGAISVDAAYPAMALTDHPTWRDTLILDANRGNEILFNVGAPNRYAPFISVGTYSGNFFPVGISPNGAVWKSSHFTTWGYDNGMVGWLPNSSTLSRSASGGHGVGDEPMAHAIGGSVMYTNICCDRYATAFDTGSLAGSAWELFSYNLAAKFPGFDAESLGDEESFAVRVFAGPGKSTCGVYGYHGDQNPPIPYNNHVYLHRSNAVLAFFRTSQTTGTSNGTVSPGVTAGPVTVLEADRLRGVLRDRVQDMVNAGHLRPGYMPHALYTGQLTDGPDGGYFVDYFHNPADTFWALSEAYRHLPLSLQQTVKDIYLVGEFENFSPTQVAHIGWASGAPREPYDNLPDTLTRMAGFPPQQTASWEYPGWAPANDPYSYNDPRWEPQSLYGMWKYASEVLQSAAEARSLFDAMKGYLVSPNRFLPSDETLRLYPEAHNAFIAGYYGYMQLEKMAGYISSITESSAYPTYTTLLEKRAQFFTTNVTAGPDPKNPMQSLAVAKNFMFLTPELGQYLRDQAFDKVQAAWSEYETVAPYWFVTRFEATYNEGLIETLWDYAALFAARAYIFQDPAEELLKYLDVPGFSRGDLFYIQNLVMILDRSGPNAPPLPPQNFRVIPLGG